MYFLRCQVTASTTLVLVFEPKFWYRSLDYRNIRNRAHSTSDIPDNMGPEAMKLNVGISSNGDVNVGDIASTVAEHRGRYREIDLTVDHRDRADHRDRSGSPRPRWFAVKHR
ncbi:hypothetical protein DPMN_187742 [Dreissena polymorpha]|uniref:Uncharacterized protein n=1 Tax=Dreissena polymorpha TaxID=45954 RepID=A0A9D4DS60_DREPO|nr:hypothetical protein DPMN_187742 [Dreissena polymorpha]